MFTVPAQVKNVLCNFLTQAKGLPFSVQEINQIIDSFKPVEEEKKEDKKIVTPKS